MSDSFSFTKSKWDIVKDKKLLETPIFSLYKRELIPEKRSSSTPFYVLNTRDWINIIALTKNREIVLVEQYRAGIHEPTLEIPGGIVDEDESPFESAKRELLEETGFQSGKWSEIGKVSSNAAILNNYAYTFLAEDCEKIADQQLDKNEDIEVHIMELDKFLELVKENTVHHAIVVAAVAHLLLHLNQKEKAHK